MLNQKCRHHKICKYYRDDAFTCRIDNEAKNYCGKFRQFAVMSSAEKTMIKCVRTSLPSSGRITISSLFSETECNWRHRDYLWMSTERQPSMKRDEPNYWLQAIQILKRQWITTYFKKIMDTVEAHITIFGFTTNRINFKVMKRWAAKNRYPVSQKRSARDTKGSSLIPSTRK